ncbi:helix-turn-helix transcriptional regulator [Vibrio algivorus]|uniref:AlpA family transcriptional regulator n=1 Tax=Vibrio algivorus TaxID=1667024 RepID=A0A557P6B1_9VIBR|nr:AlpA family transcriptional regulator [Vibrio algivorus]TVO36198.1 AlpA family transcriptional regulator [Vibrio algivorus]
MTYNTQKEIRLIRIKEVLNKTGLSRSALYDFVKKGSFPAGISLGNRSVAWSSLDVDKWIQDRIKAAKGAA